MKSIAWSYSFCNGILSDLCFENMFPYSYNHTIDFMEGTNIDKKIKEKKKKRKEKEKKNNNQKLNGKKMKRNIK